MGFLGILTTEMVVEGEFDDSTQVVAFGIDR